MILVRMACCRVWPIIVGQPLGRCGICGQRPEPIKDEKWYESDP